MWVQECSYQSPVSSGSRDIPCALCLKVSAVLPCVPRARREHTNWNNRVTSLPFAWLQVHRLKRRFRSLSHLSSAAFLGKKEPGTIWEHGEEIPKCQFWLQGIGLNPDETLSFFTCTFCWWSVSMLPIANLVLRHPHLARYYTGSYAPVSGFQPGTQAPRQVLGVVMLSIPVLDFQGTLLVK